MEVDAHQKIPHDHMNDFWSLGSNYCSSSQPRKISIGITDSWAKQRSAAANSNTSQDELKKHNEAFPVDKTKAMGITNSIERNCAESQDLEKSPWMNTKSNTQRTPFSDVCLNSKGHPNGVDGNVKVTGVMGPPLSHSIQFFTNETILCPGVGDGKHKSESFTYQRGVKHGNTQVFSKTEEAPITQVAADGKTDGRTEALRMKIQEILGAVSSQKSQHSNTQDCATRVHSAKAETIQKCEPKPNSDGIRVMGGVLSQDNMKFNTQEHGTRVSNSKKHRVQKFGRGKPRPNSDTIESDSESPKQSRKRPVTRSLTRNITARKQKENIASRWTPRCGRKPRENALPADRCLFAQSVPAFHGSPLPFIKNKGQGKRHSTDRQNIYSCDINEHGTVAANHVNEASRLFGKSSCLEDKFGVHNSFVDNSRDCQEQKNENQPCVSHESTHGASSKFPNLQEHDKQEVLRSSSTSKLNMGAYFGSSPLKTGNSEDACQSPTLKMCTPVSSSSRSIPRCEKMLQDFRFPENNNAFSSVNTPDSKIPCTPQEEYAFTPKYERESSVNASSENTLQSIKSSSTLGRNNVNDDVQGSSLSPSLNKDSQTGSDTAPIKGNGKRTFIIEENEPLDTSSYTDYHEKKFCSYRVKNRKSNFFSPSSNDIHCIRGSGWVPSSSQHQQNELEKVLMLFVLALENFKRKMGSATTKKSSEILTSVTEDIHLQLQDLDKQIKTDMDKHMNNTNSKTKYLERRLQAQAEAMKLMHERYKQDVHQHLQDCESTLEGLEMQQIELKGTLKKQRILHQKLLAEAEEAIEGQLRDAEAKITSLQKFSKGKMLQLRHAISGCLNEGILN